MIPKNEIRENGRKHGQETFNNACLNTIRKIEKPAFPILERYVLEEEVHKLVNVFTQEAIFEVLELNEMERKKVCNHIVVIPHEIDDKIFHTCNICKKISTEEELYG